MLLATTYQAALLLSILSMICWGSWANTQKLSGKWRFELFYYDYSVGMLLCALIAAYTFGSMHGQDLTFSDNLLIAAKRQMAWAVAGGMVFNLANLLLVAAIAVAGMAVAFPIGIGLALVIGVVLNYMLNPQGNPLLLFGGAFLVTVAIIVDAFAYSAFVDAKAAEALKAFTPDPRAKTKKPPKAAGAARGIVLSVFAGILMGLFYPLLEMSKIGDTGVAPYGVGILFGVGVLFSTLIYAPFFLNFPVAGAPGQVTDYFKGSLKQHVLGLLGGTVWMVGGISNFVASSAPQVVQVGPAVSYALGQGATMVSALWGLLVWREFKGANLRVTMLLVAMMILFLAGLGMISIAPLHAGK